MGSDASLPRHQRNKPGALDQTALWMAHRLSFLSALGWCGLDTVRPGSSWLSGLSVSIRATSVRTDRTALFGFWGDHRLVSASNLTVVDLCCHFAFLPVVNVQLMVFIFLCFYFLLNLLDEFKVLNNHNKTP